MAYCKAAVTLLLTHWSYPSLALSHKYVGGLIPESRQTASCALSLTKAVDMPASDSWKVEQQRAEDEPENEGEESEEDSSDEDSEAEAEMVVSRSTVDDKDGVAKGNDQSTERPASLKREKSTDSETVSPRKKQKRENAASGTWISCLCFVFILYILLVLIKHFILETICFCVSG